MRPLPYIVGALSALLLAGCGSDDSSSSGGGGGSGSVTSSGPVYDGSGAEFSGYYTWMVTSSSGFYASDWYCPKGLTGIGYIQNNDVGEFDWDLGYKASDGMSNVTLIADPDTKTYVGTSTYQDTSGGAYNNKWVDETWTLSFAGPVATITVEAQIDEDNTGNYTSGMVGKAVLTLSNPARLNYFDDDTFYGKTNSWSSDSRYVGQTNVLALKGWDPGFYGYFWIDGTYNWTEGFYFESAVQVDSHTLVGGGFPDSGYGDGPLWTNNFFTFTIKLDDVLQPVSATIKVTDLDDDADDGIAEGTVTTISVSNYKSGAKLDAVPGYYTVYTISVDSVSSDGGVSALNLLATEDLTGESVTQYGYYYSVDPFGSLSGGVISGSNRTFTLWDNRQYLAGVTPSYDLDGLDTTKERYTWVFTHDADGNATGGTVTLKVYDSTTDALLETEVAHFTLTPAP